MWEQAFAGVLVAISGHVPVGAPATIDDGVSAIKQFGPDNDHVRVFRVVVMSGLTPQGHVV